MSAIRTYPSDAPRNGTESALFRALRAFGAAGIAGAWAACRACRARHRYRRELRRLLRTSPHMIADIGLTREHARYEADKPFWRP